MAYSACGCCSAIMVRVRCWVILKVEHISSFGQLREASSAMQCEWGNAPNCNRHCNADETSGCVSSAAPASALNTDQMARSGAFQQASMESGGSGGSGAMLRSDRGEDSCGQAQHARHALCPSRRSNTARTTGMPPIHSLLLSPSGRPNPADRRHDPPPARLPAGLLAAGQRPRRW